MDTGIIATRLASSVVVPIVRRLIVREGPGAGLVDRPVRMSTLLTFGRERRTLSDERVRALAAELVDRATRAAGPHEPPLRPDEVPLVAETLARSLLALRDLELEDAQAVQLGHQELARRLSRAAPPTSQLSRDATALHEALLRTACLHILHFLTRRSTFVAHTLVAQSQQLAELIRSLDVLIERTPHRSLEDARFELDYTRYVAKRHSQITIYGLDLTEVSDWPLDAAYLSLEASAPYHHPSPLSEDDYPHAGPESAPLRTQPVDQALAGRDRVLLRGVAGSGKTTLIQWLAVTTARQEQATGRHAHLLGRVPFVLPLRTLTRGGAQLPVPGRFLAATGCPLSGSQPDGWVDRVLTAGRGLLLVDGVDEVPEEERLRTHRWLDDLLLAFPGNPCLVTSRPSAVRTDWLSRQHFTELTLSPMGRAEVALFVDRWHQAADADRKLATQLLDAVRSKPDLARLATNPLMCGLICALHRERRGYLPRGRKALYDAALGMLLERRDRERGAEHANGITLDAETQTELLQRLAYSLIKNGRSEMTEDDALRLLDRVLPALHRASAQGGTEEIYRHLLNRSGLLRQPATGSVDFVHRTFQDYLGARAAVEERDFELLADHAPLDQWEDVVRMAVAHGRADERARLLGLLIERGDRKPRHRKRLHLLALACLEHATTLDPEVRARIERRAARLLPPRSPGEARELAEIGPLVLELLPGPEDLPEDETRAVVTAAGMVGGDAALPLLTRFLHHDPPSAVIHLLGTFWHRFDTEEYAQKVIRHLVGHPDAVIHVSTEEQLAALTRLGGHQRLVLEGDLPVDRVLSLLDERLGDLTLTHNSLLTDLEFLRGLPRLERLGLLTCPQLSDLTALSSLPLRILNLDLAPPPASPVPAYAPVPTGPAGTGGPPSASPALPPLPQLRVLLLDINTPWPGCAALPRSLEVLTLPAEALDLTGLTALRGLAHLSLLGLALPLSRADWAELAELPSLDRLDLSYGQLAEAFAIGKPLPEPSLIDLYCYGDEPDLTAVARHFPALRQIRLHESPPGLDLTPLTGLPELTQVHVIDWRSPVWGAEVFPEHVEVLFSPRPREPLSTEPGP
ncbi:NACHT domain-containing protein [Streptomyces sp. AJS327]|uniref:NACHT domain-containing protein n=1 Tax=Streptomyces sp. AJS327 TaxID=2545265 RepID=UPI0015DF6047|nr:NACHT domain-containing protein [Streptomyces sp. AJS327]MBA0053089.1 NACHT domain-containing protein [Streptomyces sp. AJS327]